MRGDRLDDKRGMLLQVKLTFQFPD